MIFVTVGTHEQPFNRLIQKIDELKESLSNNEKKKKTISARIKIYEDLSDKIETYEDNSTKLKAIQKDFERCEKDKGH